MTTDSFVSFLGRLRCSLKIEILIGFNGSIPRVDTQRHRKISDALRGRKDDLYFKFLVQLMAFQIIHMTKQQSRSVPTPVCTVLLAQSLQPSAFWEDLDDQSTQKEMIAYFVIQKTDVFFWMSPLQMFVCVCLQHEESVPTRYFSTLIFSGQILQYDTKWNYLQVKVDLCKLIWRS